MTSGTLYTYPDNFRAQKALIAAKYSGATLTVSKDFVFGETNKSPEFLKKFPLGKVPAFEGSNGVLLTESNAIAYYVANEELRGGSDAASRAQVVQWMSWADNEVLPASCTWVFPTMGIMQFNKSNTERAKEDIKVALKCLNDHLLTKTFLVGERLSLADIAVATTMLNLYKHVLDPAFRKPFGNVNRWFTTVVNQPNVKGVTGAVTLAAKMAEFDSKKYAEFSGKGGDKKVPSNTFTCLPPEIILKILESVGPTDLGQVSQTCIQMRTRAEDEKLWSGKCTEEGFKKDILNDKDLQILADRSSKDKSFKPSQSKANFSKHFTREMNLSRNQIKQPIVIDGSGGSEISRVLELTDNRIIYVCGIKGVPPPDSQFLFEEIAPTVKVWSAFTGDLLYTLAEHTNAVLTVQMNEEFIITGSMDSTLKVWSSTTGACLRTLRGHTREVCCSHLREDILVSGSSDKTVRLWDVREGTCINTLEGHEDWVRCVQFNGTVVASAGADNVIKIWDQERAKCLHTLRHHFFSSSHAGPVEEIKFYGDHLLVSASWDKTVKVWNINTGGVALHTIPADSWVWWVSGYGGCIAMDENILVTADAKALNKQTGHQDNTAKMWDIFTGTRLLTFAGPHKHTREITGVRIESKFVVTASYDGSIKIWNRKSGEFVRNLLQMEEGGKVLAMKMEDAKIVALTQKASDEKEIIVLNFDIEYEDSSILKKSPEEEVHPEQSVIESSTMTSSFFSAFSEIGMTKLMSSGGEGGQVEEDGGKSEDGGSEAVEMQEASSSTSTSSFSSAFGKIGLTSREEKEDKVEEKKDEGKTEDMQDEKEDFTKLQ